MIEARSFRDMNELNKYIELHQPRKIISVNSVYFDGRFDHYDLFYMEM